MGHIPKLSVARRFGTGVLAAGLLASMAPATLAAVRPAARPAGPVAARLSLAAVARARARSVVHTADRTGVISGVIRFAAGSPFGGTCVTASMAGVHATARTGADGRYLLGGLRPGQYRISVGACAGASRPSGHESVTAYWTSGPGSALVRAGQVSDIAPVSAWQLDVNSLAEAANRAVSTSAVTRKGSISGLVTGNSRPLRGVCAVALGDGAQEKISLTGKTGRYRISGLLPGRYDVAFVAGLRPCPNKGGWLTQWYPDVNALVPTSKVKTVRVRAGKDTAGIDGQLKKGGQISGTVRAKSGRPLPGICVTAVGLLGRGLTVGYTLVTNKRGQYATGGLYPGGYQIQFTIGCGNNSNLAAQWWPNQPSQARAHVLHITGTRHITNINATMHPGASVSGVVKAVNAAGKPLANVCVFVVSPDGNADLVVTTDRQGRYSLVGLSPGRLGIQFDPTCSTGSSKYQAIQRNITVTAGQIVTGFNAFLPAGGGISGVVTDRHGQPVGGVCVQVNDFGNDITRTRPNGRYSLVGVPDGRFQVMFFGGCGNAGNLAPQFYPNSPTSLFGKLIKFRPNTVTPNIDAAMQPGGALTGLVTDTAGHRLSKVCVTAGTSQVPLQTDIQTDSATAQAGRYLIRNLAPGAYDLGFGCDGFGQELFPSQLTTATATLVAVSPGATTTVPAEPMSRAGAIAGTVTGPTGKPFPFTCVLVIPVGSTFEAFARGFAATDSGGHYRVGGLAPGRYRVEFIDCSQGAKLATQWYRRRSSEATATRIRVFPGRTDAGINAAMRLGGTITGLVTGPTGKPAKAICVSAFSPQGLSFNASETGRTGRYRLTGLSTGRWLVTLAPCFSPKPDLASMARPGAVRVVAPRTVTGVNVKMRLAGSLSGRITSIAGQAIPHTCVLLEPANPDGSIGFEATDSNGRYVIAHLGAGNYQAYFGDPSCADFFDAVPQFAPQWFNGQAAQTSATTVHVSAGARTAGINGALSSFATMTGTVTTRSHAAIAGECVTAVPFRDPADPVTGLPVQREVAVTGRTGRYTLTGLTPGQYKIEFTTGCGASGFATQWWDNAASAGSAGALTVSFGTITGINATLHH